MEHTVIVVIIAKVVLLNARLAQILQPVFHVTLHQSMHICCQDGVTLHVHKVCAQATTHACSVQRASS